MDKPKTTAKDFFLWLGAMVTFYWSIVAFIGLLFDYINYAFPNALAYYPSNPYESGISYEMASLIILLPSFLLLMQIIRKGIAQDPSRKEIWVRRWAVILTLFLAGVAIAIDLITLLTTFLNGEALTSAFLLKVGLVVLVAAGVFMHFIADLWGFWERYPARRNAVAIGVAVLALVTIISGFFIVGTPGQARLARFDAQRVSDLQNIQSQVTYYWQAKQKLPSTLTELNNAPTYGSLPVDPQTGSAYEYIATGALSFTLCTTFNAAEYSAQPAPYYGPAVDTMAIKGGGAPDNWQHGPGRMCFDRTIDPAFYPPLNK